MTQDLSHHDLCELVAKLRRKCERQRDTIEGLNHHGERIIAENTSLRHKFLQVRQRCEVLIERAAGDDPDALLAKAVLKILGEE